MKNRLSVWLLGGILLSCVSGENRAQKPLVCDLEDKLNKLFFVKAGPVENYSLADFQKDLEFHEPSRWKRKVLYHLWKREVEMGHQLFDVRSGNLFGDGWWDGLIRKLSRKPKPTDPATLGRRMPLPYVLDGPRDLVNGVIAVAKARGLKPAHRYVVIPSKVMVTIGTRNIYSHVFTVLGLSATGALMDRLELTTGDPLVEETDPQSIGEDEVMVLVKLTSDKKGTDKSPNTLGVMQGGMMDYLKKESPGKVLVLDLSSDAGVTRENAQAMARKFSETQVKGKKIKKIIVGGHGLPGTVLGDGIGSRRLENFEPYLEPLKPHLSEKPEIHFGNCFLAGDEKGRQSVRRFSEKLLPPGGKIRVNRLLGFSQSVEANAIDRAPTPYTFNEGMFVATVPIFGVTGLTGAQILHKNKSNDRKKQEDEVRERNLDPAELEKPRKYEYVVPGE